MREANGARLENEKRWLEHVRLAREHDRGMASYCREAGISLESLRYWRSKSELKNMTSGKSRRPNSVFVPVQVLGADGFARTRGLPDTKWVADLILQLWASATGGQE